MNQSCESFVIKFFINPNVHLWLLLSIRHKAKLLENLAVLHFNQHLVFYQNISIRAHKILHVQSNLSKYYFKGNKMPKIDILLSKFATVSIILSTNISI